MHSLTLHEFFTDDDLLTCHNTPEFLAEALKNLILTPDLIAHYQENGYSSFLSLYARTQKEFTEFIQFIDKQKES